MSPVLANIYLDRLDKFVEQVLLPAFNRGTERKRNPVYRQWRTHRQRLERHGLWAEARAARRQAQRLPTHDPNDPAYRRLRYVRYADDTLLGFAGPRSEAEAIKRHLATFLRDHLKLELSEQKTLITHARSEAARFLGYEVVVLHDDRQHGRAGGRNINGRVGLKVPLDVVRAKCAPYLRHGRAYAQLARAHNADFSIIADYQQEFRGLVDYYRMAFNLHRLNRLKWVMEQSLTHTLAAKHKTSVAKVYDRYTATVQTDRGPRQVLRVTVERDGGRKPLVAQWGDISLARRMDIVLDDAPPSVWNNVRSELVARLLADACELCGSRENVEVHHVRALKDLQRKGRDPKATWARVMASRRRKTLVVCERCHRAIHAGYPTQSPHTE